MMARLKHYSYSLYFDIKNFKFVRDFFLTYLSCIGLSLFLGVALSMPWIMPMILIVLLTFMNFYNYFTTIYPHTSRAVEDLILMEKYPYLYKKMTEKEKGKTI